jgi:BCCT family betaine/carnitine transporter
MQDGRDKTDKKIDRTLFGATVLVILFASVPIVLAKEQAASFITLAYDVITKNFGILYLLYGIGILGFLLYLGASRYGRVVLGDESDKLEFSTPTWVAMLFSAGVGAGLLYWAVIEWGYYIQAPPFGLEPRSPEAIEWSASYGLFHWGLTGWALFCLPTLAIAYPYYVRKIPFLRLSTACISYLPNGVNSKRGRFIDFLYMLNLVGGTGTSLGLSTPMIAASFAALTGLEHNFVLEVSMVLFCIAIFATSAYIGLHGGFRRLADLNMLLAFVLLFFVLAVGPTLFILKTGLNSIGLVLQNFIRMNTWTDPIADSGFVESWTVFYWAWWIAYGPFVGIFVTRISRGRTIRQVISGMLIFGTLGAAAFFIIFGNYALHLELTDVLSVTSIMKEASEATAIATVFTMLPLGKIALAVFFVVSVIFLATTYDSASYTLASVSTQRLEAGENPVRWSRVFWACSLGVLPITLMFADGGLRVVLSATIVVSLPLLFVGVLMCMSLMKMLKADAGKVVGSGRLT